MKQNLNALVYAITNSLAISALIIAASIFFFSCSKADALVPAPSSDNTVVQVTVEGAAYDYVGMEVKPSVIAGQNWYNVLCTEGNNNTLSLGFRVGVLKADSLYLLNSDAVLMTFKKGSVTYATVEAITSLHVTSVNNGFVTATFGTRVRNNATGKESIASGKLQNVYLK